MQPEDLPFILDGLHLELRALPQVPELKLMLLADELPWHSLKGEDYHRLMQQPPYWAFCWGGGMALARWIFDHPVSVKGRDVVDFGAGSGVAGIAAARVGARSVLAVDIDEDALAASRYNAGLNGVSLTTSAHFATHDNPLLLAADICYEESGFEGVSAHIHGGGHALIAESRRRDLAAYFPSLQQIACFQMRTFPDLEEAPEFDSVHIFSTFFA